MPEHTIPSSLIEKLKEGRAVLVVGAGIGVPSWKHLLERMNETLATRGGEGDEASSKDVAKLLHKGNLVRAAGFLARALGETTCDRIAKETWANPGEPSAIARAIARLPFRHVWTTFPGDVIESAMSIERPDGWPEPRVVTYDDVGKIRPRQRSLLKVLGDFDSFVVTPKSVRRALSRAESLRDYARPFYAEGALFFVGFRYGDPDLAALLDRVFGQYEPPEANHFLVGAGVGPVTVDELGAEHHIEVINLAGKGADEVAVGAVVEYLEALEQACLAANVNLSQVRPDVDDLEGWLLLLDDDVVASEARDAISTMSNAAREANDAERLAEILLGQIDHATEDAHRATLLRELASVFESMAGDLPHAFTALTAAVRAYPADTTAVDEAERLAADTDAWAELVADVAEVAPTIEDPALAASYWARLGRWYETELKHYEYGAASYRQALKLDSACVDAHRGLAEILRKQQQWAELADALRAHVNVETDGGERAEIHAALGELYETQLASTSRAIDAYQAAVDLDPKNDDALSSLERLYRRDERWGKLATVLELRAEIFENDGDSARASIVRRELATLRADKLGDLEGAIGKYERAVESNPADIDALRALDDLYEKVGRADDHLRTLEQLSEYLPAVERVGVLRRLANELEEVSDQTDRAVKAYERLLELEPAAEDAHRGLIRVLRDAQRWYDLVTASERHIASIKTPTQRVEQYLGLASVCEKELDDPHRAIEAYLNVLAVAEDHRGSLAALGTLYQRVESWERSTEILVRLAELEGDRGADHWAEAGRIAAERLDDRDVATRHLEKALALEPENLGALTALARLHKAKGNWTNAVEYFSRAEASSPNRLQRVELLLAAAEIAEEKLEDPDQALALRLRVLKLDGEHVDAGNRVADALVLAQRWEDALPILEMLARKAPEDDRMERARREAVLGHACESLKMTEKAARHYRAAVEADPDSLDAALGLASMLFAEALDAADAARFAEVDKRYREILARHRAGLADGQVADIWYRLGVAAKAQSDDGKAEASYKRALERDPHHAEALVELVAIATARGDWRTVVSAKRDQLDDATDGGTIRLLEEIGDIQYQKLKDPEAALGAYLEAVKLDPESHVLLHKILEVYTEQKQWRRAIDTLGTLAAQEQSPHRRAKYRYAAAVIARDELRDPDVAVENFSLSLDDAPDTPKAFDAVDTLLSEKGDYKLLARAYRKMLKRVGEGARSEYLLELWTRLGDICLNHLGDNEAAIAAYEVAASLAPDDMDRHEQLADLYLEAGDSRRADAIEELQILIQGQPDRPELYRALCDLYRAEGDLDRSYCLAQALVFLGVANADERALYEQLRPQTFQVTSRRLTEELWQKSIIHNREDRHLNVIFGAVAGSLSSTTAQPPSAYDLAPAQQADLASDSRPASKMVKYATNVLAIEPAPNLYLIPMDEDGIRIANTADAKGVRPSVLISGGVIDKSNEVELAFEVGKRLAYLRPERYLNFALQSVPKMENAFAASLAASGAIKVTGLAPDAERLVEHLRATVSSPVLEQVGAVGSKVADRMGNGLVAGWRSATDLTANRVGLILCNDLETAARVVATESPAFSTIAAKDRLRDLLAYSVSESYFAVRRHLGIAVRSGAAS